MPMTDSRTLGAVTVVCWCSSRPCSPISSCSGWRLGSRCRTTFVTGWYLDLLKLFNNGWSLVTMKFPSANQNRRSAGEAFLDRRVPQHRLPPVQRHEVSPQLLPEGTAREAVLPLSRPSLQKGRIHHKDMTFIQRGRGSKKQLVREG